MRKHTKNKKSQIFLTLILMLGIMFYNFVQDMEYQNRFNWTENLSEIDISVLKDVVLDDLDYKRLIEDGKFTFTNYYHTTRGANFKDEIPLAGEVIYHGLDYLGRAKGVIANIDYNLIQKERQEDREDINVDPVGWGFSKKVEIKSISDSDELAYKGYFYNRSHLLADSLGGLPILENLVTGTRMQNVGEKNIGGMAYPETMARNFFKEDTDVTMLYQVIPIYYKEELLPRYVVVDIKTSDGSIDEHIIIPNTANLFKIDYRTGEWRKIG